MVVDDIDAYWPDIIDIEAKGCANKHNLDVERVQKVFHKLDDVKWYAPNFPRATALDEAIRLLTPKKALEVFETNDLKKLAQRVWIVEYLNNWLTPFYTLDELGILIDGFIGHLQRNKNYLLKTGFPQKSFGQSYWFDRTLNKLLYVKIPLFHPLADAVLHLGFVDPDGWQNLKQLEGNFTKIQEGEDGDLVYDYVWAKNPHTLGRKKVELEDGIVFVPLSLDPQAGEPFTPCSYEDANFLPGLTQEDVEQVEFLRPKFFELKTKALNSLSAFVAKKDPWGLWNDCLCHFAEILSKENIELLFKMDSVCSELQVGGTYSRDRKGQRIYYRNGGLSDLFDFVGRCEKELKLGSLRRTKQAFLQIPERLFGNRISSYYEVIGESWQSHIDEALEKFLLWESEEREFWSEYRDRVNDYLTEGQRSKVPVSFNVWIDAKHKNLYVPNIQSYIDFQKTHIETAGQLAQLKISTIGSEKGFMPVKKIAEQYKVNVEALRKRLERERKLNPLDIDLFQEIKDRGLRQSKYLWNVGHPRVISHIEELKRGKASTKRQSKKK